MVDQSTLRLFAVIDSFAPDRIVKAGGIAEQGIAGIEKALGVRLPDDYRAFLCRYGAITARGVSIYGVSEPVDKEPSILWALTGLWEAFPEIPRNLIPIRDLSEVGECICLECPADQSASGSARVVAWRFAGSTDAPNPIMVSASFAAYIVEVLIGVRQREAALKVMEEHVETFEKNYLSVGKLPRNHVWRPYRFCSQDVVLGLVVVRHAVDSNCLEVDVCLAADIPEYEQDSGAKVVTSFLLSEAYKCGGSMEIRFTENVEGGHVPRHICILADRYGVAFENISDGRITSHEARELFVAITDFSPALADQIRALAKTGKLSAERACYSVHHGLWTRDELEAILLGSPRPDSILGGDATPEQRHLYLNDLLHARSAVMGGLLDRKLAKRERGDGNEAVDLEDDVRPLQISFDAVFSAKVYECSEELPIPWGVQPQPETIMLSTGKKMVAVIRARDADDLRLYLMSDIDVCARLVEQSARENRDELVSLVVPRDFEELPSQLRGGAADAARECAVRLMVCPETTLTLDTDAGRRLASSRIIRE